MRQSARVRATDKFATLHYFGSILRGFQHTGRSRDVAHWLSGALFVLLACMLPAAEASEPVYATDNESVRLLVDSARHQLQSGRGDVAALTIERAIRIEPENPALWYQLARVRYVEQSWSEAVSLGQRSVSLAADYPQILAHNQNLFTAVSLVSSGQVLTLNELDAMTSVNATDATGSVDSASENQVISTQTLEPASGVTHQSVSTGTQSNSARTKFGIPVDQFVEPINEPRTHAIGAQARVALPGSAPALVSEPSATGAGQVVDRSFSARTQSGRTNYIIPDEAMPAPGYCRIWFDDQSIENQPSPVACQDIDSRIPVGARLILGRSRR